MEQDENNNNLFYFRIPNTSIFKVEDFEIQDYEYNKEIKLGKIPVAI